MRNAMAIERNRPDGASSGKSSGSNSSGSNSSGGDKPSIVDLVTDPERFDQWQRQREREEAADKRPSSSDRPSSDRPSSERPPSARPPSDRDERGRDS
ncbi:hypothetical protein [Azospirillum soli]|uniref:hypothetical protein n=1 Tax=Azospirillum soli TaxID=1304799 RepID=UPI001AE835C1|nr:hypothetical protein [Azospirillum soli]MBP2312847.1 hypothetical protein [Azospirillum soli]